MIIERGYEDFFFGQPNQSYIIEVVNRLVFKGLITESGKQRFLTELEQS